MQASFLATEFYSILILKSIKIIPRKDAKGKGIKWFLVRVNIFPQKQKSLKMIFLYWKYVFFKKNKRLGNDVWPAEDRKWPRFDRITKKRSISSLVRDHTTPFICSSSWFENPILFPCGFEHVESHSLFFSFWFFGRKNSWAFSKTLFMYWILKRFGPGEMAVWDFGVRKIFHGILSSPGRIYPIYGIREKGLKCRENRSVIGLWRWKMPLKFIQCFVSISQQTLFIA